MSEELARIREETEASRAQIAAGGQPALPQIFRAATDEDPWDFSMPTVLPRPRILENDYPQYSEWCEKNDPKAQMFITKFVATTPEEASSDIWTGIEQSRGVSKEMETMLIKTIFKYGFVLAGGVVCNLITRKCDRGYGVDYDIFAPCMTPKDAETKFFDMVDELKSVLSDDNFSSGRVAVYRTLNCITALNAGDYEFEIQLITREYGSIAEVIYGFDIPPCAVAWDGNKLYMTPAAVYAHKTGVFELDLTKRRRSFEDRIAKYVEIKGFGVVMPNLDMEKSQEAYAEDGNIKLPFMHIKSRKMCGNCITTWNMSRPRVNHGDTDEDNTKEARRVYGALPYFEHEELAKHNVRRLLHGDKYLVWERDETGWSLIIEHVDEIAEALCHIAATNPNPCRIVEKICGTDAVAMGHAVMWLARLREWHAFCSEAEDEGKEINPADYFEASNPFYTRLQRCAENLVEKASTMWRTEFVWKTSEEGTDLDVKPAAAQPPNNEDTAVAPPRGGTDADSPPICSEDVERIFKMERITAAEWYGDFYRAD